MWCVFKSDSSFVYQKHNVKIDGYENLQNFTRKYDGYLVHDKNAFYFREEPTSFWITNPLTYVRNNVAAGGEVSLFMHVVDVLGFKPFKTNGISHHVCYSLIRMIYSIRETIKKF